MRSTDMKHNSDNVDNGCVQSVIKFIEVYQAILYLILNNAGVKNGHFRGGA